MIRIITDSSSELDPELAARLQVDVIPIHIYFGETEYLYLTFITNWSR